MIYFLKRITRDIVAFRQAEYVTRQQVKAFFNDARLTEMAYARYESPAYLRRRTRA